MYERAHLNEWVLVVYIRLTEHWIIKQYIKYLLQNVLSLYGKVWAKIPYRIDTVNHLSGLYRKRPTQLQGYFVALLDDVSLDRIPSVTTGLPRTKWTFSGLHLIEKWDKVKVLNYERKKNASTKLNFVWAILATINPTALKILSHF